jgi:hypothetical protein
MKMIGRNTAKSKELNSIVVGFPEILTKKF